MFCTVCFMPKLNLDLPLLICLVHYLHGFKFYFDPIQVYDISNGSCVSVGGIDTRDTNHWSNTNNYLIIQHINIPHVNHTDLKSIFI